MADGLVADAAFVDGSHIFHNVFVDLFFLRELVRPGGLVVLDDCCWPSVATAVRYFETNTGWRIEPIDGGRLRAYRLPNPKVEPSFERAWHRSISGRGGNRAHRAVDGRIVGWQTRIDATSVETVSPARSACRRDRPAVGRR